MEFAKKSAWRMKHRRFAGVTAHRAACCRTLSEARTRIPVESTNTMQNKQQ
jgi:hypothetical protein